MQGSVVEDLAALRKLRDESECDELKEAWPGEDPSKWQGVAVSDDRVTELMALWLMAELKVVELPKIRGVETISVGAALSRWAPRCPG